MAGSRLGVRIIRALRSGAWALCVGVLLSWCEAVYAKDPLVATTRLVASVSSVEPGGAFSLGVYFKIEPFWHIYWKNPGAAGLATKVRLTMPPGFAAGNLKWPQHEEFVQIGNLKGYGYKDEVLLFYEIKAPAALEPNSPVRFQAHASWLGCGGVCVPGEASLELVLPVGAAKESAEADLFAKWRKLLPSAD